MKFKTFFSSKDAASDGIRVIARNGQGTTLEQRQGGAINLVVVPRTDEISVNATLDGSRSVMNLKFSSGKEWSQSFSTEQQCRDGQESLSRALSRSTYTLKQAAISIAIGLATIVLLMPTPAPATAGAAATAPVAAVALPAPNVGSVLDDQEMRKVFSAQAESGFALNKGGKAFTVFSDPNCPYCRELEKSIAQLDKSLNPIVLPLGFKTGARDISSAILCSKDPAAAWEDFMRDGKQPTTAACAAGYAKVDANMALFRELQLGSTPTLVSPSGAVVVGSGTPDAIRLVMSN